jgi:hypothetical protein
MLTCHNQVQAHDSLRFNLRVFWTLVPGQYFYKSMWGNCKQTEYHKFKFRGSIVESDLSKKKTKKKKTWVKL